MLDNGHFKNFFSNEEMSEIQKIIDEQFLTRKVVDYYRDTDEGHIYYDENHIVIKRTMGRLDIPLLSLPENILKKVQDFVNENHKLERSEPFCISAVMYAEYNLKYGVPDLVPHMDYGNCGIKLDYHIDSNIKWPVIIENREYHLDKNDMLFLYPLDQYHWRPKREWSEGEYTKVIFFEFLTPDIERLADLEKEMGLRQEYNAVVYNRDKGDQI